MQIFSRKKFIDLSKSQIRIHTQIKLLKKQKGREELHYTRTSSKQRITPPMRQLYKKENKTLLYKFNKHPTATKKEIHSRQISTIEQTLKLIIRTKRAIEPITTTITATKTLQANRYQSRNNEVKKKKRLCQKQKKGSTH